MSNFLVFCCLLASIAFIQFIELANCKETIENFQLQLIIPSDFAKNSKDNETHLKSTDSVEKVYEKLVSDYCDNEDVYIEKETELLIWLKFIGKIYLFTKEAREQLISTEEMNLNELQDLKKIFDTDSEKISLSNNLILNFIKLARLISTGQMIEKPFLESFGFELNEKVHTLRGRACFYDRYENSLFFKLDADFHEDDVPVKYPLSLAKHYLVDHYVALIMFSILFLFSVFAVICYYLTRKYSIRYCSEIEATARSYDIEFEAGPEFEIKSVITHFGNKYKNLSQLNQANEETVVKFIDPKRMPDFYKARENSLEKIRK